MSQFVINKLPIFIKLNTLMHSESD